MKAFTVLGAEGAIGRALVRALSARGDTVQEIRRCQIGALMESRRPLGFVINAVGLTGDFRTRPYETMEAHVGLVARCLQKLRFESFLLLSSTRVYARSRDTQEDVALLVRPGDLSDIYNISKLAGEALCLSDARQCVRVARLSNVVTNPPGPNTFLGQVLGEGQRAGHVIFREGPRSAKDYVGIDEVTRLLPKIAQSGQARIYNVATGRTTTHATVAELLRSWGWSVTFAPDAPDIAFPEIEVARVRQEFGAELSNISDLLATMQKSGQEVLCSSSTKLAVP